MGKWGAAKLTTSQNLICFTMYHCYSLNVFCVHHWMVKTFCQQGRSSKAYWCLATTRKGCGKGVRAITDPSTGAVHVFVSVWVGFLLFFLQKEKENINTLGASLQQVTKNLFLLLALSFSRLQHPCPLKWNPLFLLPSKFCPTENETEGKNCLTPRNWLRPVNQLLILTWVAFSPSSTLTHTFIKKKSELNPAFWSLLLAETKQR